MNTSEQHENGGISIFALLMFTVVVLLFIFVGTRAGTRGVGVSVLVSAVLQKFHGRISYGWEGRVPSGYISGSLATFLNFLFGLFGLWILILPDMAIGIFGWDTK